MNNKVFLAIGLSFVVLLSACFSSLILSSCGDDDNSSSKRPRPFESSVFESSAASENSEESETPESTSDVSDSESSVAEPEHGWVINEYGYTYLYDGCGYLQFNYKKSALDRYVSGMNSLAAIIPENTKIYNIIAPVSSTFADIPRDIYVADNFYNLSQSAFVSTASASLSEKITTIPIIKTIEDLYDEGEYVFYRTDSNWTPLAAYTAYSLFCKEAGKTPYSIGNFEKSEGKDFLGSFYKATKSPSMENAPDELTVYFPLASVGSVLKVYSGDTIFSDYVVCRNNVAVNDGYNVFLGRKAGRYEINTNAGGGSLLIIGDSSACPVIPFLMSHYSKIDYINPELYGGNLQDFLAVREYDDVLTICYSVNAVSGDYLPALNEIIGETKNG